MTTVHADVVVAGAGHNALITAAYVALSGRRVVVLDARAVPGGGAATEELMGPGYLLDSCSTGHTLIQTNPVLMNDELGLLSEHGLEYLAPDPFAHVALPDGEHLTAWLDLDRTCEEIARFSKADAAAYRRLLAEYDEVKHVFGAASFTPVGFGPSLDERLRAHPRGGVWRRRAALSAYDVITREFESRHVQAFLLWQAYQTLVPVDAPGSGVLASSVVFGRQKRSWSIPRGGSGQLTDALVRCIESRGGTVVCSARVSSLVLGDGGACVGVRTEGGDEYLARDAVVSTIHVKHLVDMAPAEAWGEDFLYGVETFDVGVPCSATFLATSAPPEFETDAGPRSAVSAGLAGWPEDVVAFNRLLRDGAWVEEPQWVLVATPTLVDPSRAPEGHHTVKFLAPQSYGFADRAAAFADALLARVEAVCPGFSASVLDRLVRMPEDVERANEHMIRGTFHGGDRTLAQSGALRPVPGYASHRMPIPGLYQTGGTTHPGGSITGGPGRNAAVVLLQDLGTSLEEVVSHAGRPRAGRH